MFKSYLKIAVRNLRRHRAFSFINITGLAVGLACALLIFLYVQDELSYDRYHENAEHIYRLVTESDDASFDGIAKVPGPWGPIVEELADVEQAVRFRFFNTTLVSRGEDQFYERGGFFTDPEVFEVFSYPFLRGEAPSALTQPNSIVLTASTAARYFGEDNPLGQALLFNNETEYTVTGVIEDVPATAHFTFPFLASRASETDSLQYDWRRFQYYTYVRLREGASPQETTALIPAALARHIGEEDAEGYTPRLQPLTDIHLRSNLFREIAPNGNIAYIYIFSAVAFFILLIACINFMNLATARSARRAREVGVRKASGARRGALIQQFLGESLFLSIVALVLALGLVSLLLPSFNTLTGKSLSMNFLANGPFLLGLIGVTLFVGIVAGSYPAFVLSAFRPVSVLKGEIRAGGRASLRKGLVVFQFAISVFLIAAVITVNDQLGFIQSKALGFNKDQVVIVPIRDDALRNNSETVKQELLKHPGVVSVSVSGNLPGGSDYGFPIEIEGVADEDRPPFRILVVDEDFPETYGMTFAAGHTFSRDHGVPGVLVNEEAAQQFGWDEPLGKTIGSSVVGFAPAPVVGVIKDFHFRSLHEQIGPLVVFVPPPNWLSVYSIRLQPEQTETALAHIEQVWNTFDPTHPFSHSFLDQTFAALYQAEEQVRQVLGYATSLAILIACLGLFGLAAFMAEQRTKEIGVRKVLGASVGGLVMLLSKDFARLVGIALIVATPLAYFAMSQWLGNFAYSIDIGVGTFVLAGVLALGIALLTVSYQALKAALSNPIKALRYE